MLTSDTERAVTVTAPDGCLIPARMRQSEGDSACVLLLHGITTNKNEYANFYVRLAEAMATHHIATLRIDFRGHGESSVPSEHFTIASQVLDTVAALDWMSSQGFANAHLFGASFGAAPSLFASDWRPGFIASTTLLCPVLDYEATFLRPSTEWAQGIFNDRSIAAAWTTGRLSFSERFAVGLPLLLEMAMIAPYRRLREMRSPVTVIHGRADSMVPFQISERHCADLQHVSLIPVDRMEHGFTDVDDDAGTSAASARNFELVLNELVRAVRGHERV